MRKVEEEEEENRVLYDKGGCGENAESREIGFRAGTIRTLFVPLCLYLPD